MALKTKFTNVEQDLKEHFISLIDNTTTLYPQKRPSASQSGLCSKRVSLNALMPERSHDFGKCFEFFVQIGNTIENVVQEIYKDNLIASNIRFDNNRYTGQVTPLDDLPLFEGLGFTLGGEIDLIVNIDGEEYVFDVKSTGRLTSAEYVLLDSLKEDEDGCVKINTDHVKKLQGKGAIPDYIAQLQTYSAVTGYDNCFLLYVSRSVQEGFIQEPSVKFVNVPTDEQSLIKVIAIAHYGVMAARKGLVAEKNVNLKKSHCGFCSFIPNCWYSTPHGLVDIDIELSKQLKLEAMQVATTYVSKRYERNDMIKKVL